MKTNINLTKSVYAVLLMICRESYLRVTTILTIFLFAGFVTQAQFPVVAGTNTSASTDNVSTHNVALPSNIQNGDLLLIFWADRDNSSTVTIPNGWTQLYNQVTSNYRRLAMYRIADGTEGAIQQVTTSNTERSAHNSYRISAGTYTGNPVAGTVATGTSANPNPPSLTSGFGAVPTLWIAAAHSASNSTYTAIPTNYSNLIQINTGTDQGNDQRYATMGTARRTTSTATEDPSTFTISQGSQIWGANTVAIRGSNSPNLFVTPGNLSFGYVASGNTSIQQSYTLSGSLLTGFPGSIIVTAPENFEVSLSPETGFGSTVNVLYSSATLANTTIYVRFSPTGSPKNYSGNITNTGGGASTINVITSGTSQLSYCSISATNSRPITKVIFSEINNTSSANNTSTSPYEDFTDQVATVQAGQTYNITVEANTWGISSYNNTFQYYVFFDWNQNGSFTDANEVFYIGSITNSTGVDDQQISSNIIVPENATLGYSRMRVKGQFGENTNPCQISDGSNSYGQAEDYSVNILPSCQNGTLTLTSGTGSNIQTLCNNNTAINAITYSVGGEATGASVTGLPNGVTGSFAGGVFTISGTPTQAGTFSYTVTTSGTPTGCTEGTATGTITVNPLPTATLSGNLNICEGSAAALSVNFTGTSPWSIVLQTGSGAQVTIDDITQSSYSLSVYPTENTTYTIVSVTDANCTNTGSGSASVTVSPTAQIGSVSPASSAVCLGSGTGTLTLTGYSGYTILNWQKRLGTGDWENIAHTGATYSETPAEAGTWEYRVLTEATGGGCPNISASAVVTVNPSPTALLSGNNLICDGEETTLSIYVTATGNWTLQLSDGSTVTGTGTGFASKTVSPTVNTTYTLTSLSDATCSALPGGLTGSAAITINPTCPYTIIRKPQQLTALIDGGGNLCPGDPNPVPINVGITGGNQPYTVTWPSGNPGLPNGSQSGITGAQATPFTFGVTPSSTITYSGANVMVFDSKGCVSAKTGSALVNVSDVIVFAVDYSDISCFGGNDGWIMIEVDGTGTYYFSNDNGQTYIEGEENSPVFTFENLSIGTYKIRIKDQFGCESPDCDEEP